MFTGIIEAVGRVESVSSGSGGLRMGISAPFAEELKRGESVCTAGACLTGTFVSGNVFFADVSKETLGKTRLKDLKKGYAVNLERAMKPEDRLGGHIVTGHVDCVGMVEEMDKDGGGFILRFSLPEEHAGKLVQKGSVAVDGISLTVVESGRCYFTVALIPHTMENSTLKSVKKGDKVNIETDILAKHVEKLLERGACRKRNITEEFLHEKGF